MARNIHGAGPATYTLMLACIGGGAVVAAMYFPRWRRRFNRDQFVVGGTMMHAAMSVVVVFAPNIWVALPAIVVLGMAWISTANSLTLAAQVALPNWVRARGMAIYQMALMGGAAAGSLLWGQVAGAVQRAHRGGRAAVVGPTLWLLTRRLSVEGGTDPDFSPAALVSVPEVAIDVEPDEGPVMVTVEYQIDPAEAAAFAAVMRETRRARLGQGALSWGLFKDTSAPGRYIEYFVDESWVEHHRRLERFSAADAGLRERRAVLSQGRRAAAVSRYRRRSAAAKQPLALVAGHGACRLRGHRCRRGRPGGVALARDGRARGGDPRSHAGHRHGHQLAQQRGHPRRAVLPAGFVEGNVVRAAAGPLYAYCAAMAWRIGAAASWWWPPKRRKRGALRRCCGAARPVAWLTCAGSMRPRRWRWSRRCVARRGALAVHRHHRQPWPDARAAGRCRGPWRNAGAAKPGALGARVADGFEMKVGGAEPM